jgi:hypothetical protein
VSDACQESGTCSFDDILQVFANVSEVILGITGSVLLLLFVYGGFLWLTSAGKSEQVEKGRKVMVSGIIALLVIFLAFAGINYLQSALRGGTTAQENLCELAAPPEGYAGLGYACLNTTGLDMNLFQCYKGFCPGADSIQCCKVKTTNVITSEE